MREFLIKNKDLIKLNGIEVELGMPQGYLHKYIVYGYLPKDWHKPLEKYLRETFKEKFVA